jgi:ribonucrease Y
MSFLENPYLIGATGVLVGGWLGYWLWRWKDRSIAAAFRIKEQAILDNARREADAISREARLQANEDMIQLREQTEKAFAPRREELSEIERRLNERESLLIRQMEKLSESEKEVQNQSREWRSQSEALARHQLELDTLAHKRREELQALAHLSEMEARQALLKEVELDALKDASRLSRRILDEAQSRAEEKARRIISLAVQRYAGEHVNEISSTTVALPGEEIKGRIIGREGRNIRAFEAATGVTVLIDDTPNAVVLSAFDPVRRVIARESMERLLADGRIHPSRIEEMVSKVSQEIEETIVRYGEDAVQKVGLSPFHPEVVRVLGRLRFRHSFSQNVLDHSIEVAHLTGLMAAELGLDTASAKRAGLLHDIGKAINHEVEGGHALVGADLLRRYGESDEVVNAVASHHDEVPHIGPLGILVGAADAISASRPGARSETMTAYIKRVESLERIGRSIFGVEKCFAVQAGRELRVLVQPESVTDEQAHSIARTISKKIEDDLQYPGQIRVTVVRETRCIEYAK